MKISKQYFLTHETKLYAFKKFLLILLVFISYFSFISIKYGLSNGFFVTILTWSFFVLCTPIADAGFLISFPLRLISNIRMILSGIFVYIVAIVVNLYAYFLTPQVYNKTILLQLFKHILDKPIPFWLIIILSFIGTFLSIEFGDELIDKTYHHERTKYHTHKNKHRIIMMIFLFTITFVIYTFLLKELNVDIPL